MGDGIEKKMGKQKGGKFRGRNRQTSKQKGGLQMTHRELKRKIRRQNIQKKYRRWVNKNSKRKTQKGGGFGIGMAAGMALPLLTGFLSKNKKLGFGGNSMPPPPPQQQPATRGYSYPPPQHYYPPPPQYYQPRGYGSGYGPPPPLPKRK